MSTSPSSVISSSSNSTSNRSNSSNTSNTQSTVSSAINMNSAASTAAAAAAAAAEANGKVHADILGGAEPRDAVQHPKPAQPQQEVCFEDVSRAKVKQKI